MTQTRAPRQSLRRRLRLSPYLYVLPLVLGTALFTMWPIINVMWLSLQRNYEFLDGSSDGMGFGTYGEVLADPNFRSAVRNTALYAIVVVPGTLVLGLVFASLLNRRLRGRRLFQTLYFLPMITSTVAIGLAWRWIFNRDYGVLNYALSLVGIPAIDWLNSPAWAMPSLMIFGVWSQLPLTTVLLLVGMQNIDPQYAIAARVDGASPWRTFVHITVPQLTPTIVLVMILNFITSSRVFDELFPLFNGKPGIGGSLYTVVYYIYDVFYNRFNLPKAGAAAVLFSVAVLLLTVLQLRLQRRRSPRR